MKDLRNLIADQLVYWAVSLYTRDDLKYSLARWVVENFKGAKGIK